VNVLALNCGSSSVTFRLLAVEAGGDVTRIPGWPAVLAGADAVVFTGAMGANSPDVRARILRGFEWAGLVLDDPRNRAARGAEAVTSAAASRIRVLVIPADEERVIARETAACLAARSP
jgi:acetate kinase